MNSNFFDLSEEKQDLIINSALTVFSNYDYKKASTDEIVKNASISKGLLYYYFENKKQLYLFLYDYSTNIILRQTALNNEKQEKDFFKVILTDLKTKLEILSKYPNMKNFLTKVYLETDKEIRNEIEYDFYNIMEENKESIISRIDKNRFNINTPIKEIYNIIMWLKDGFILNNSSNEFKDHEKLLAEFTSHLDIIKRKVYKKKYI